jgi:hypothetical protein
MTAYFFRFVDDEDEPTGYAGIAFAANKKDLFWMIDEFGDPYSVQIAKMSQSGMCVKYEIPEDEEVDAIYSEVEISERAYYGLTGDKRAWKRPSWPELSVLYGRVAK